MNPDALKEGTLSGHMGCVQALKELLILIPAAFPAHSWTSQHHFSQKSGVSLLGPIFLGENPAMLTNREGWSSSFQESSSI